MSCAASVVPWSGGRRKCGCRAGPSAVCPSVTFGVGWISRCWATAATFFNTTSTAKRTVTLIYIPHHFVDALEAESWVRAHENVTALTTTHATATRCWPHPLRAQTNTSKDRHESLTRRRLDTREQARYDMCTSLVESRFCYLKNNDTDVYYTAVQPPLASCS